MAIRARSLLLTGLLCGHMSAASLETLLQKSTGLVQIPPGTYLLHAEIVVPADAHDLTIEGRDVTVRMAPDFHGRAAIVDSGGKNVAISGLTIDGNRAQAGLPPDGLPPPNVSFAQFTKDNGILALKAGGLTLESVKFQHIAGFPILVSASEKVRILMAAIADCGSINARKTNNATGGILFEEGTHDFSVTGSTLDRVLGNGIWTHSLEGSPRNADGVIVGNRINDVGRDAIQIGQATRVTVAKNGGSHIGYPAAAVDSEGGAIPAALATAGDTDRTKFDTNGFEEVNGACADLAGFHDGELRDNSCINNEDRDAYPNGYYGVVMSIRNPRNVLVWGNRLEGFLYGGLLLAGRGHQINQNHFLRLNLAHCNEEAVRYGCLAVKGEPDLFRSGIYLRSGARDNRIDSNEVTGYGMGAKCVTTGPGAEAANNQIGRNNCSDDAGVSARVSDRGRNLPELVVTASVLPAAVPALPVPRPLP